MSIKKVWDKNPNMLVPYYLMFSYLYYKQNISSNRQGDATIFKINIIINYTLIQNDEIILKNKISKQSTYNNINDKFELLRYEENIIKNLSEKSADEMLMSITTIQK